MGVEATRVAGAKETSVARRGWQEVGVLARGESLLGRGAQS